MRVTKRAEPPKAQEEGAWYRDGQEGAVEEEWSGAEREEERIWQRPTDTTAGLALQAGVTPLPPGSAGWCHPPC